MNRYRYGEFIVKGKEMDKLDIDTKVEHEEIFKLLQLHIDQIILRLTQMEKAYETGQLALGRNAMYYHIKEIEMLLGKIRVC